MKFKLGSFFNLDNLGSSIEAVGETRELAELIQDQKIKNLAPWVSHVAPFLKPLASPEAQLTGELSEAILPFIKITGALVKYIRNKNEPKTFYQCIVLVCFQAFLEAIQKNSEGIRISKENKIPSLKSIKDIEISKEDAEDALTFFPQSKVSNHFKEIIKARFIQVDLDEALIDLLLEKSIWGASSYINTLWSDLPDEFKELGNIDISDWRKEKEFELGLIKKIKKETKEKEEEILSGFTKPRILLNQLYVRLEVEEIDGSGNPILRQRPEDSHLWVRRKLFSNSLDKIILIQGDSGQGKSVFCSMFFGEIYKEIYPAYIPIIINLRELDSIQNTLSKTFESHLEFHPVSGYDGWLNDPVRRYLILLDGFDEIALEVQEINRFTRKILECQKGTHNQFVITGRSLFSQEIEDFFEDYSNIVGARFCTMSSEIRAEWIDKWSLAIANNEAGANFKHFLEKCPKDIIDELAGEPLSLHLLAQMVQSKVISESDLLEPQHFQVRSVIYQKALDITLQKIPASKVYKSLKKEISLTEDTLKLFLSDIASWFVLSDYRPIEVSNIKDAFKDTLKSYNSPPGNNFLTEKIDKDIGKLLTKLLTNFYVRIDKFGGEQYISFTHRSFSDFLHAHKLKKLILSIENQLKVNMDVYEKFFIMLNYEWLTEEVVQYVIHHLLQDEAVISTPSKLKEIFEKLYDLYWFWSDNFILNSFGKTSSFSGKSFRQKDVSVGLNLIIFVLELHRHLQGKIILEKINLCENSRRSMIDDNKLLRIVGYSCFLEMQDPVENICGNFSKVVGKFLYKTRMENIKLQGVNLSGSDLHESSFRGADLSRSKFKQSNLAKAIFRDAILDGADFSSAVLKDAILYGSSCRDTSFRDANLQGANFSKDIIHEENNNTQIYEGDEGLIIDESEEDVEYNFENTDFSGADLRQADFEGLDLTGVRFKRADLRNANFKDTILEAVCFQNSDLSDANFENAYLANADFQGSKLRGAKFNKASLKGIKHDSSTTWEEAKGLQFANDLPAELFPALQSR